MKNLIITIFFVFSFSLYVNGYNKNDTTQRNYSIGIKAHYGNILPHAKDLWKFGIYNPYGLQFDFGWYKDEEKSWDQCNCYAKVGLSFIWFNFGYPEVLGNSYNLIFYYEPLLSYKKKFYTSLKAGFGPSIMDNPYDEIKNPENEFFSATVSYILLLHFNFKYRISSQLAINASACYNHISNGGVKQPNRGINFPTFNLGFDYNFNRVIFSNNVHAKVKDFRKEKIRYYFAVFGTAKTIGSWEGYEQKNLPVYGIYGSANKRLSRMNGLIIGGEITSDGYVKERMKRLENDIDHRNVSFIIGHELLIGKIKFSQNLCFYLYNPYKSEDDLMYQRYTLQYQITDHLFTGFSLKAHRHVAHIFDIRLGLSF